MSVLATTHEERQKEHAIIRLILRKLLLLVLLVPLLHAFGFFYALRYQPAIFRGNAPPPPPGMVMADGGPEFGPIYREYLHNLRQGDLGKTERTPLTSYVPRFINRSLILIGVALLTTLVLGPLLALLAISRGTGRVSPAALTVFTLGTALPGFFLGTLLIVLLLLTTRWGWFDRLPLPVQGYGLDAHLVLPMLVLAVRPTLYVAYVSAGLLEHEFQQDYIRVAKGKGLRWRHLLWRHAMPNVAAAMITTLGRSLQMVIGGLVLVETLFDWRGIGWLMMTVVGGTTVGPNYFNAPLLALLLAIFATLLIATDLLASIWAYLADPRLRQGAAAGRS